MGYAGGRFSFVPNRESSIHLATDAELGVGFGAGGIRDATREDGRDWYERAAFGGYTGVGLGVHIRWFALYGRVRVQGSKSDGLLTTGWSSGVVGMQFRVARTVDLYTAAGYNSWKTAEAGELYPVYEFGVAVHFNPADLAKRRRQGR